MCGVPLCLHLGADGGEGAGADIGAGSPQRMGGPRHRISITLSDHPEKLAASFYGLVQVLADDLDEHGAVPVVEAAKELDLCLVERFGQSGHLCRTRLILHGSVRSASGYPSPQDLGDLVHTYRLCDVVVHASRETPRTVPVHGGCSHGDHGRVTVRALDTANLGGGLVTVHLRHLAVHEHSVVASRLHRRDRFSAIVGDDVAVTQFREHLRTHQLVHLVVLHEQDRAHSIRVGSAQPKACSMGQVTHGRRGR